MLHVGPPPRPSDPTPKNVLRCEAVCAAVAALGAPGDPMTCEYAHTEPVAAAGVAALCAGSALTRGGAPGGAATRRTRAPSRRRRARRRRGRLTARRASSWTRRRRRAAAGPARTRRRSPRSARAAAPRSGRSCDVRPRRGRCAAGGTEQGYVHQEARWQALRHTGRVWEYMYTYGTAREGRAGVAQRVSFV